VAVSNSKVWNKNSWRRLGIVFLLLAVLWLLAWIGARWLIVGVPLDHVDAIVVLSGSSTILERAQHAAGLYSSQRSQKIILTNDNKQASWLSAEQRNPYYFEIAVDELRRLGVPQRSIEVIGPPVNSTWDEAIVMREYSKTHNLSSILIVTSSYHSRRALWTFRTVLGDSTTEVGLDPVKTGIQTPPPATWWLHRIGWKLVLGEYLKLIYYRLR
jgi:uncharacterized SAM-binding protein YcdF (DUF218 family)